MEDINKTPGAKAFLAPVVIMIVLGAVLFLPAGSLQYREGWIYWSGFSVLTLFIAVYFSKKRMEN